MTVMPDISKARAALLLERLEPLIQREIAEAERRTADARAETRAMMDVCKAVGKASDRLLQAMHTPRERAARKALDAAIWRMREQMRLSNGR